MHIAILFKTIYVLNMSNEAIPPGTHREPSYSASLTSLHPDEAEALNNPRAIPSLFLSVDEIEQCTAHINVRITAAEKVGNAVLLETTKNQVRTALVAARQLAQDFFQKNPEFRNKELEIYVLFSLIENRLAGIVINEMHDDFGEAERAAA